MTYSSFSELSFEPTASNTKAIHISNFELGCVERAIIIRNDLIVTNFLNNVSTEINALYTGGAPGNGDVTVVVNVVNLGVTRTVLQGALQ